MVVIAIAVVCVIFIFISWDMVKYSQKIKESERHNNRVLEDLKKEKSKTKRSTKVSEDQVSNKRKYRSAKKKAKAYKSIDELIQADPTALDQIYKDFGIDKKEKTNKSKVKKNAGRNKKKV